MTGHQEQPFDRLPVESWPPDARKTTRLRAKSLKLLTVSSTLGVLDGLQARYMTIGNLGEEQAIAYQVVFMLVAVGAAYFCLFDEKWSPARNLTNLLVAIPAATLADNISIDVQSFRPYLLLIPQDAVIWRINVFGHTILSPIAYWVNQDWLAPGLINGYATAIGILVTYLTLQYFWERAKLDSKLPAWKPVLDLERLRKR